MTTKEEDGNNDDGGHLQLPFPRQHQRQQPWPRWRRQGWQQQLYCWSPASALPTGPTAGQRDLCDPPFWPVETPLVINNLFAFSFFLAFFYSLHSFLEHSSISYIYDGRLFLFVPARAASHVQESHLAPKTWTKQSEQFKQYLGIWEKLRGCFCFHWHRVEDMSTW